MATYRVTLNGNDYPHNSISVECDDIRFDNDSGVTFLKDKALVAYVPAANVRAIERVATKCCGL